MSTIYGTSGSETLTGTTSTDTIDSSQGGSDTVNALGGDDTLIGGAKFDATDTVNGGDGFDTLELAGNYTANVVFGADTLRNVEEISLGSGFSYSLKADDKTVAAGQHMFIDGSSLTGPNYLVFNGSAVTDGRFSFRDGTGNDVIQGGQNSDQFTSIGGVDLLFGHGGDDKFLMGATLDSSDWVIGGDGNDTVFLDGDYSAGVTLGTLSISGIENLVAYGGHSYKLITADGNVAAGQSLQVLATTSATETFIFDGSAETDGTFRITSGQGDDVLTGGAGNDYFTAYVGGGDDTIHGGGGNDIALFGDKFTNADFFDGGDGKDHVYLSGAYPNLTLGGASLANVELFSFTGSFDYHVVAQDSLIEAGTQAGVDGFSVPAGHSFYFDGSAETDGSFALIGGFGGDTLIGGDGHDGLQGKDGNDVLRGGLGFDELDGGAGRDTADYSDKTGNVSLKLKGAVKSEVLVNGALEDTFFNIENANGGSGNDSLKGDGFANVLKGNGGGDTLIGNAGGDTLRGGAGNDRVNGGAGADDMWGGSGRNTFVYKALIDSGLDASHRDQIMDFGKLDKIDVSAIDAIDGGANNAFVLDAGGAFSAGEIHQSVHGNDLLLEFNTDADSDAEMSILLAGHGSNLLTAGDFIL